MYKRNSSLSPPLEKVQKDISHRSPNEKKNLKRKEKFAEDKALLFNLKEENEDFVLYRTFFRTRDYYLLLVLVRTHQLSVLSLYRWSSF